MRFVKSCKNLFRIFLYVCTLIGLQLDYSTSTEFTPTRIFNRTIQNHKNSLAYETTKDFMVAAVPAYGSQFRESANADYRC